MTTVPGKGALSSRHPLCLGSIATQSAAQAYLASCDAILVVGCQLSALDTNKWQLALPPARIHIDIDARVPGRNYSCDAAVVADAAAGLQALLEVLPQARQGRRHGEVRQVKEQVRRDLAQRSAPAVQVVDAIRRATPEQAVVVGDVTIAAYWSWFLLDVYQPRSFLYPYNMATLGFGIPAAIGAKLARPDRPVLAICGDGGFQYTAVELATAVHHDVPIVVLVLNNHGYGILRERQRARYGRTSMTDLGHVDITGLARATSVAATRVTGPDEAEAALRQAFAAGQTHVIELCMDIPGPPGI